MIKNLGCSDEFNALNFKEVKYIDEKGEKRPMYLMTQEPIFPRCDVAFDAFGELLASVAMIKSELSHRFCGELHCITKVLLELSPSLANQEDMSAEEVQKTLLQNIVINFVVSQFHQIIAQCNRASQMAVMGLTGGEYESIH